MDEYMGAICHLGCNYAPYGWMKCEGQLLPISQYSALFSLLGATFGGDGRQTFALPDLRGRSIVHPGAGPGLQEIDWGQDGGDESIMLTTANLPMHQHPLIQGTEVGQVNISTSVMVNNGSGINETDEGNNTFGYGGSFPSIFSEPPVATKDFVGGVATTITGVPGVAGGSQPVGIRSPYLAVNTCICIYGNFPPRP